MPDEPRFRILCNVQSARWSVTFLEEDCRTSIGPWLLFDTAEQVEAVLRWGHASEHTIIQHRRDVEQWGVGGVWLHLTRMQRASLIARGRGWPWNGYELQKMKAAGKYPPERLTPAQEELFLRRRKTR